MKTKENWTACSTHPYLMPVHSELGDPPLSPPPGRGDATHYDLGLLPLWLVTIQHYNITTIYLQNFSLYFQNHLYSLNSAINVTKQDWQGLVQFITSIRMCQFRSKFFLLPEMCCTHTKITKLMQNLKYYYFLRSVFPEPNMVKQTVCNIRIDYQH